jgi:DNA-binding transcriptional MerR regulator
MPANAIAPRLKHEDQRRSPGAHVVVRRLLVRGQEARESAIPHAKVGPVVRHHPLEQVDGFHLTFNLREAVERELAVRRPFLLFTPQSIPALAPRPDGEKEKRQNKIQIRSSVKKQHAEVARLLRQQQLELFQTIHRLKATGMTVTEIADDLDLNRRRIDRWLRLDTLPERNRMEPRPGMIESFRGYLQERWDTGCRHGRTLFAEIQALGYVGAFSPLAQLLSPWRQPPPLEPVTAFVEAMPQRKQTDRQQQDRFHLKWRLRC